MSRTRGYAKTFKFALPGVGEFPTGGIPLSQQLLIKTPRTRQVDISAAVFDAAGNYLRTPPALGGAFPYAIVGLTQAAVGLTAGGSKTSGGTAQTGIGTDEIIIVGPDIPRVWIVPPDSEVWGNVRAGGAGGTVSFGAFIKISVFAIEIADENVREAVETTRSKKR